MNWLLNLKTKTENLFETLGTNCPPACCCNPEDLLPQQWDSGNFSYSSEYISFWLFDSLIACVDAWFIILGIANSLERKYGILFYKIIDNLLSHLIVKNKSVLVFWFVRNLMHTNFSVTFLITLYAIWGSVPQYYAEEWIDCALLLLRCRREIPLCSSTVVTCQQFGCNVWTGVQISMSNFHHRSYNSLSWTNFSGPQENQDLPMLHWKSRQILSTLTPFNGYGLSFKAAENSQLQQCAYWKIYISQEESELEFQMTNIHTYI